MRPRAELCVSHWKHDEGMSALSLGLSTNDKGVVTPCLNGEVMMHVFSSRDFVYTLESS